MNANELRRLMMIIEKAIREDNALTLYHGTNEDIDEIDITRLGRTDPGFIGQGFYLTGKKARAVAYARGAAEIHGGKPYLITFKVSPQNTLVLESTGAMDVISELRDLGANTGDIANPVKIKEFLLSKGYDSAMVSRGGQIFEFVAYDSSILTKVESEEIS